jgi:hypothetical protein
MNEWKIYVRETLMATKKEQQIVFLEEIIMGNNSNLEKKEQNIRPNNLWLEKRNKILVRGTIHDCKKRCQNFRLRNKSQLQIREKS